MALMDEFKEERESIKNQPFKKRFLISGRITNGMYSAVFLQPPSLSPLFQAF